MDEGWLKRVAVEVEGVEVDGMAKDQEVVVTVVNEDVNNLKKSHRWM